MSQSPPQSYQCAIVLCDWNLPSDREPMHAISQGYPCRFGHYGSGLHHADFTRFYYDAATGRAFTDR